MERKELKNGIKGKEDNTQSYLHMYGSTRKV